MQKEVFPIERRVANGTVLGGREAQAGGGAVDPRGFSFQFEEYADVGFVDGDEARFRERGELGAEFFVEEARGVAEAGEDKLEGVRVGNVELNFFAALVALAVGGTFICDGG